MEEAACLPKFVHVINTTIRSLNLTTLTFMVGGASVSTRGNRLLQQHQHESASLDNVVHGCTMLPSCRQA
jgi:hypothetical protein